MCCGWRKIDFHEEETKLYYVNLASCLRGKHIMIYEWPEHDKNRGGYMLFLYLKPWQYEIIRNIEINVIKDLNVRFSWAPKEYILYKIYEVLPEMFEE